MTRWIVTACFFVVYWPTYAQESAETLADIRQDLAYLYVEIQRLKRELSTTEAPRGIVGENTILQRVDAIELELKRLTDSTERLEFRVSKVIEDGTNRVSDLEFRLVELEGGDISQLSEATTLGSEISLLEPDISNAEELELVVGEEADFDMARAALDENRFGEAAEMFKRFGKTYPKSPDLNYAHFLLAMCYYEKIVDEKKDLGPLLKAQKKFKFIIKNYPSSDYALDAEYKLDLIQDYLASKEMYIASHYMKKKKWIASINRYKTVVEQYEKTMYVEEALHRLVELYYTIGLENESQRYASLLGYNYQSSKWYEKSYKIFNKKYKSQVEIKKEKKGMLNKFKRLFD